MRKFLTTDPVCIPHTDGTDTWTFTSRIGFEDDSGTQWWVEVPFRSDGASIPRLLQLAYGHPFSSDYIRPAALHDYYYCTFARVFHGASTEKAWRRKIDKMFFEALLEDGVHRLKAYSMYVGVRVGGWVAWREHARAAS